MFILQTYTLFVSYCLLIKNRLSENFLAINILKLVQLKSYAVMLDVKILLFIGPDKPLQVFFKNCWCFLPGCYNYINEIFILVSFALSCSVSFSFSSFCSSVTLTTRTFVRCSVTLRFCWQQIKLTLLTIFSVAVFMKVLLQVMPCSTKP